MSLGVPRRIVAREGRVGKGVGKVQDRGARGKRSLDVLHWILGRVGEGRGGEGRLGRGRGRVGKW